jgi:catechol 2,3-dioxygenase-like lactoylglutathione lyase family enzyme
VKAKGSFIHSFYFQVVAYTLVIFCVMYWSGSGKERSLYTMFAVESHGALLPVTSPDRALKFYHDVLDLKVLDKASGVTLPEGTNLLFTIVRSAPVPPASVVLRVRNRLSDLHDKLLSRAGTKPFRHDVTDYVETLPPERVSEIVQKPWGKEFVVADPDGNKVIFYQPRRRSQLRP